jgi:cysteine synthase A
MPESMSLERRSLLEAYGAEIVLTPAEDSMQGAIEKARALCEEHPDWFMPQQFENPANPAAHRETTAREILAAMGDVPIDAFVAGVGTGGTVTGVGKALKTHRAKTRVVAVEPRASAVLSGGEPGPTKIQGLAAGFVPAILDTTVYDEVRTVDDRAAYEMKKRLAHEEGMLVGMSAGAAVAVAVDVARELGGGRTVVTVLPDTGERYFSLDEYFR